MLTSAVEGMQVHKLAVDFGGLKHERAFGCYWYCAAVSQSEERAMPCPEDCAGLED